MIDYEIIWNGVNDGHDGDLLRAETRIDDKCPGDRLRATNGIARAKVLAALPTSRDSAVTFRDLATRAGCTGGTVNSVLYHLREEGILASEPMPGPSACRRSRQPQLYWRRA